MSGERIKRYWCDDCNCFVKKDHRCQQWDTVYMMPEGAFKDLESLLSKVTEERDSAVECIEELKSLQYHSQGMGCGLEDNDITDRYDAMAYGWEQLDEEVCRISNDFLSSLTENKS